MEFIQRAHNRTEHDAFILQVEDSLKRDKNIKAVEVRDENNILLGWKIQNCYE